MLFEDLVNKQEKLSLIGLGYVGMPIAVAFAKVVDVIGYDLNENKIKTYKNGIDPTKEVGDKVIKGTSVDIEPKFGPDRPGDIKHSNADISKARELLGYNPEWSFERGIEAVIDWYKENFK